MIPRYKPNLVLALGATLKDLAEIGIDTSKIGLSICVNGSPVASDAGFNIWLEPHRQQ